MKITFATTCFIICALLNAASAHAEDAGAASAHHLGFVKYSQISIKVKANLAREKIGSLAHIKVNTNGNGEVFLSGAVRTRQEADKAISIARATEGVTSVTSTIQIRKEMVRMIV